MKANDQLQTWFEDNDALERAINGEYVHACANMNEYYPYDNVFHI